MTDPIPFNRPYSAGKELHYIAKSIALGNISSGGEFTRRCSRSLEQHFGIERVLMTTSCTSALEIAMMLADLHTGDEVIMPSFTFVSTASAAARLGATPVFVDVRPDTLNIDESTIEAAITPRTKAIVPVHYAGVGCEMSDIMEVARRHELIVIEDAAQAVNAKYRGRYLGSIGHLAAYSFHETKNFVCGEGGALCVNDTRFARRAEILRDKGTDRQAFFRGEVQKYTWVDIGSSYSPSELVCAYLYAQLEEMDVLTPMRSRLFSLYQAALAPLQEAGLLRLPIVPSACETNSHIFHILLPSREVRDGLMDHLRSRDISAVFHYVPLHSSPMGRAVGRHCGELPVTDSVSGRLLRLPFYYELSDEDLLRVVTEIREYLQMQDVRYAA